MKNFITLLIAIGIIASLSPLFAKDQEKLRVAIMDFSGQDITPRDAKKISDLIRTEMINTGQYTIIERSEMGKILQEQGFSMTGCIDVSCDIQAGKLLSARKMLVGTIMQLDEQLIINGRIIDVEKGTADIAQKEIAESRRDLVRAVESFVNRITLRVAPKGYAARYDTYRRKAAGKSAIPASRFGWAAFPFLCLSLAASGVGIYADIKYKENLKTHSGNSFYPANLTIAIMMISHDANKRAETIKRFKDMRLYSGIASGITGGVAIILGIVWLARLTEEEEIGANGAIGINRELSLVLPARYYNDCFNFTKRNQYGFGLGLAMKF